MRMVALLPEIFQPDFSDGGGAAAGKVFSAVKAGVVRFTGRGTLPARAEAGGDRAGAVGHSGRVATEAEPEKFAIVAEIDGENPPSGGSDLHAEAGVGFVGVREHSPSVGPAVELDTVRADGVRLGDAADGYEFAGNGVETVDERGGAPGGEAGGEGTASVAAGGAGFVVRELDA
jgi:hypothetical protein